ncbi:VWA domain-containing protein [Sporosarcina siberiensis]|uniref:VWA domain-containing protein n=1 Tax=Sporosarcina siberiensis TaxID=1365606 RepID=A0ABW4SIY7_9BACL
MKIHKHHKDNHSVLNTDAFDKRRFKEIFEMSSALQRIRGEGVLPMFEHLLADIWASLYKMKPEITVDEVDSDLKVNKLVLERIMTDESYTHFRNFTKLDDLASAIGTVKLGEKTNQWLAEQIINDDDFQKQLAQIHPIYMELQMNEQLEGELIEASTNLNEKLKQMLQDNSESFSQELALAVEETRQVNEGLKSLFGGCSAGSGEAELKKIPLRDQLALAEKIASTKKMKEIAEWAGRFKQVVRKKQKTKRSTSMERSGVTLGNHIERLLPMELGFYIHPLTRKDFLRRFVDGQTMQYEQKGREVLGKGPIILCLDQSGSMDKLDAQSKGFTLALMSIAKKQRRNFCLILFSTRTQVLTYGKGSIKSSDMITLAQTFLGGGTDFTLALTQAVNTINESAFKEADLIFVTDGEDCLENLFLEEFVKQKKEKEFNVLSLVIGDCVDSVESFSDKVVQIQDFDDEGSFRAFEI